MRSVDSMFLPVALHYFCTSEFLIGLILYEFMKVILFLHTFVSATVHFQFVSYTSNEPL
uniref:Uncharacterized protein n=1 Tax=Anguilla anguilla TaxID=7936 RepID=A0A0E9PD28_ANGAN